ncbi:MAG: hypothetical protein V1664_04985 [Candidatus Uhrbacteria bacterium]
MKFFRSFFLALNFLILWPVSVTQAGSMDSVFDGLDVTAVAGGFASDAPSVYEIVGRSINVLLTLIGVLLLVMTVYGGFQYVMSHGDKEKAAKAQKLITYTVLGAVIILSAFAISGFILDALDTIY